MFACIVLVNSNEIYCGTNFQAYNEPQHSLGVQMVIFLDNPANHAPMLDMPELKDLDKISGLTGKQRTKNEVQKATLFHPPLSSQ